MKRTAALLALPLLALACAQPSDGGAPPTPPPPTPPTPPPPGPSGPGVVTPVTTMPGHETLRQDTTHKEGPRLLPVETYLRSYLALFGGLAPLEVQARVRSQQNDLFDTWNDYLAVLGLPDHRIDTTRGQQTNALLLATLERTGIALCDVAVVRDLEATPPLPVERRVVFAFETPGTAVMDAAAFAPRLDVLHRTFLGYPLRLAPAERAQRLLQLYTETVARHGGTGAAPTRFRNPADTGWAAVCYALVRHPEFQLY